MISSFRKWLEFQTLGGGFPPPKEEPTNTGSLGFADYHSPGSRELPPTKKTRFKMKKK